MGICDILQVSWQIRFCHYTPVINKCHPQQNFVPSFLNFIFDCSKIWLDWSKEKHWFNKIEATRIPSIECKDSLLKGMVCCGVTSILCCIWVSEYFAIDLSIYFGYCHLPSSKASIKGLQQCLLKIHVLVVWLLVFLILSVIIFFSACLHELSKWPALQGYFFPSSQQFCLMKTIYSSVILGSSFTAVTVTDIWLLSAYLITKSLHVAGLSQSEVWSGSVPSLSVPLNNKLFAAHQVVNFKVYFIDW